jgi:putative phosphoserine phosphatase/1-acylglycerol-3-phosphate O-acyltransferase
MTLDKLLADVYSAPRGPEIGAFFDYDGTLITGYSALSFYNQRFKDLDIGPQELAKTLLTTVRGIHTEEDFAALLDLSLDAWSGRSEEELEALGRKLFVSDIAGKLHTEVWELVEAHHAMDHTVVLASSATRFQVEPMAEAIEAAHVLCTPLEVVDGLLTGKTGGTPLWGNNKAQAVVDLARRTGIDLTRSFGYSNGDEDVPFLSAVGHPRAVSPDQGLREEASRRGWPVLDCVPRGKRPGLADIARTGAFYGAFAGAFAAGLGAGLLNRNRTQIIDVTSTIATDLGFALAGVEVEVLSGAEHLWSHRPAVFIFNHQSNIDAVVAMKLVRNRYTGVAKKEAKNIPGFGQLFQIGQVAFIDRGNVRDPKAVLAPAVEKIRDKGLSIVIAPEGTRSPTPRLGPFKKGAFHIAMQAGVPVVAMVMKGQNEVMWRGSQTLRPGRIEVVVLPPFDTSGWRVRDINARVQEIRNAFLHTLAHWPGRPSPPEFESSDPSEVRS